MPSLRLAFFRKHEPAEEVEPRFVRRFVDVEAEVDAEEELAFHLVELCE
jgi:hypothetical protein